MSATPATPAPSCAPPTPPAPTPSCSPATASTPTTASACAPRPGSLFHLPVVVGAPVADALPALRAAGLRSWRPTATATSTSTSATDAGLLDGPTAWVFGNEAWGLPAETRALADDVVRVPIHGRAETLNLATAAAVCLYASARAQRPQPSG